MSVIVIGYDGSDGADAALDHALALAPKLGAEVLLVYGIQVAKVGGEVADLVATLRDEAERILAAGRARVEAAGATARTEVAEGRIAEAIADIGVRESADMIVVGSTGERPLRGLLIGSTPYRLLHLSPRPVLVVRV